MKTNKGFTLIELMVTLVVVAILLTVAIPSFRSIVQNNRAITQANELITAINLTRSEAIKRGRSIFICGSTDQATCDTNNWALGWIVVEDTDANGSYTSGGDTNVLRVWNAMPTGTTLTNSGSVTTIRYLSSGLTDLAATNTFTLTISDCTGNNGRTITVLTTGRPNVSSTACP